MCTVAALCKIRGVRGANEDEIENKEYELTKANALQNCQAVLHIWWGSTC